MVKTTLRFAIGFPVDKWIRNVGIFKKNMKEVSKL